jgi:hypothetical protein
MDNDSNRTTSRRSTQTPGEGLPDRFAFSTGARRKSTAKKSTSKKSTAKKSTAKKSTAKAPSTVKKSTAKKSTAKAPSTAKPATKTTAAKSTAKPAAKTTVAKKTTAKAATAKTTAARKTTARTPTRTRAAAPAAAPTAERAAAAVAPAPSAPPKRDEAETSKLTTVTAPAPAPTAPARPAAPAPPGREVYRRRRVALILVAVLVIAFIVVLSIVLANVGKDTSSTGSPSPGGSVTSPTPSVSPTSTVPVTSAQAVFPGVAKADAASLQVQLLGSRDEKCVTHTFDGRPAYLSDCTDWGDQAKTLYFFYVTLENRGSSVLTWKRNGFFVISGADKFVPFEVRDEAAAPTTFLPNSGKIPAQGSISGYVVFETDNTFAPTSLTYHRLELDLAITFEGAPGETPRG